MSICFLVSSIGRPNLSNLLRSLFGQFDHGNDKIYVYFDGRCDAGWDYFQSERELYGDDLVMTLLDQNRGWWGHGIRNEFQKSLPCTHIMHADDDDYYVEGVMPSVRSAINQNPDRMLLYKIRGDGGTVWNHKQLAYGNIATPCGVIPNKSEIMGEWGYFYGGDYQFYRQTADKLGHDKIVWVDKVIYATKPHERGLYR